MTETEPRYFKQREYLFKNILGLDANGFQLSEKKKPIGFIAHLYYIFIFTIVLSECSLLSLIISSKLMKDDALHICPS